MTNAAIFTTTGQRGPATDATNDAGGRAYALGEREALAQLAMSGTFNGTFYVSEEQHLARVRELASKCDAGFIARLAVLARQRGMMRDVPVALLVTLAARKDADASVALSRAFPHVVDSVKNLRSFVQMIRSGAFGRKSLGTLPRRLVRGVLARDPDWLFRGSYGTAPTFADVIRLAHPKPATPTHGALFQWALGKPHDAEALPPALRELDAWRKTREGDPPERIPFPMIAATEGLTKDEWTAIAMQASWTTLRMNLNTFHRHGVFENPHAVTWCAAKLADPDEVRRSKCFPYQLLAAFRAASDVPVPLRLALQHALELATENVPAIPGRGLVAVDISGSMESPVTGHRAGATTAVRCVDVAALVAACLLRKNPDVMVVPFNDRVHPQEGRLNPLDSVATNTERLARLLSGGTACGTPLAYANAMSANLDWVVMVSDNQSWLQQSPHAYYASSGATSMASQWAILRKRNAGAKMVCIDIQPGITTQVSSAADVLNVGGFGDVVFDVAARFLRGDGASLLAEIDAVEL